VAAPALAPYDGALGEAVVPCATATAFVVVCAAYILALGPEPRVLGRPILYKTTRDFLIHFGLKDIGELPSMEEFEELIRNQASAEESVQSELPLEEVQ